MKRTIITIALVVASVTAKADSAFGPSADLSQFFQPFDVNNIPHSQMQTWPYYKHVSMNMADFVTHGVKQINATNPVTLTQAQQPFDLNREFEKGKSYLDSLQGTQTKGFVVLKGNQIFAEFYDNGYNRGKNNNLQSASKSYAGLIIGQLIDAGKIDPEKTASFYLPELAGSVIGEATIRNIANMASGVQQLGDYHTPGSEGYKWELEIGLQPNGEPIGHFNAIKNATGSGQEQGTKWEYTDQNTDALGLIAEKATGKPFATLLQELADKLGHQDTSSIAKTSDGTTSPAYGINVSALDFALFHQYIAEGKAGEAFYQMATDVDSDLLAKGPKGEFFANSTGYTVTYGAQTFYLPEENILMSVGSFGQLGFSDLETGIAIVNQQDWSINMDQDKGPETIRRSVALIKKLRAELK
ncbi:serine hydrolase domain-containing protein [Vibrio mediterranei]|uniref:serine hydrolase domain-containing protein n=1 Tax=Vibrio mediterranei TaxID=689 RepID=UPI0040693D6C